MDAISSQGNISFPPFTRIMDFDTPLLACWTGDSIRCRDHMHLNASICLKGLAHHREVGEIQWHENPLRACSLCMILGTYGMLVKHHLFLFAFGDFVHTT